MSKIACRYCTTPVHSPGSLVQHETKCKEMPREAREQYRRTRSWPDDRSSVRRNPTQQRKRAFRDPLEELEACR